jgi:hypothetical protein
MSWEELCTRVRQSSAKRLDLALHRVGLEPGAQRIRQSVIPSRFFFGKNTEDAVHRAALLRAHMTIEAEAIVREADDISRHRFRLLGYENLDYGPVIDWHLDPVHRKCSPLKPWFKINFLDFQTVGDHKIIWELNRHQHLVTLAKAWHLTGNREYATELANQWYSWRESNPYPLGINWASTLEVAFRSFSWLWVRNLVTSCEEDIPATFQADLLFALQAHGRHIERYLSTYFSPNTHLLGEAVALFFIGTLCPEIAGAKRWQRIGWGIVLQEAERQVYPDGVYFEQSLYYHVYALDLFLHARHLANENGVEIPEPFDAAIRKMLAVVQALSESGSPEGFGDDDGGRVFNPRRNRVECMTDPLAVGSVVYGFDCYPAAALTEEAIWLFGERAITTLAKPRPQRIAESRAFVSGGIYLINDNAPYRQQMMIDAGRQGVGRSGHGHADALSIRFSLDGRRFLIDPGTYLYVSGDGERDRYRGTAAHNTLRIDSADQAVADGIFAWSSIPNVNAETWVNGQTFDYFVGSHDGYRRLPEPAIHRRSIFHVRGGLSFVHDFVEGKGIHLLESFWHFAPDVRVKDERGAFVAKPDGIGLDPGAGLVLLIDRDSGWKAEIAEGFVSPVYGATQPASVVRFVANTKLPEECGVLLAPVTQNMEIGTLTALSKNSAEVCGYRYETLHSTEVLFFYRGNIPWTCGPWASDASLLYCKLERGHFAHVIMVSGSFAEWRGEWFISRTPSVESFEWSNRPGFKSASPADGRPEEAIANFEVLDSAT